MANSVDNEALITDAQPLIPQAHGMYCPAVWVSKDKPLGNGMPIRNAKVIAKVLIPNSAIPIELELTDDGTGYPDITKGDGIYSAYFTNIT